MAELRKTGGDLIPYIGIDRDGDNIIDTVPSQRLEDAGVIITNTPLGSGVIYTQSIQDRFGPSPIGKVAGFAWADQAGTLALEESDDNVAWSAVVTVQVSAKTTARLPFTALTKRWYRFKYTNGASAQGDFILVQQVTGLGILLEYFGTTIADRPDASSVPLGATFMVVGNIDEVWQSNGTEWVVLA